MRTLSKEAEEQVIAAVKKAVSLVDKDGMEPTDAIEKVAREESWGPHMVRFASHAYNTGRQTAQRESSTTALDKFAEFPVADPEEVVSRIWPKTVKTASDITYSGVSSEYSRKPSWVKPRAEAEKLAHVKQASAQMTKSASAMCKTCGKEPCCCVKKMSLDKALDHGRRLKVAAEEARHQAAVTYGQLVSRMGMLADYFRKNAMDRLDFGYVEKAAGVFHGDKGLALMDWVFKRNHMERTKTARAADTAWGPSLLAVQPNVEPWNHIEACIKLAVDVKAKRAADAVAREAVLKHAGEVIRPFASAPCVTTAIFSSLIPDGAEKTGGEVVNWLGAGAADNGLREILDQYTGKSRTKDDLVNSKWEELEDPAHDAKLRQIKTQTMLADMMNDDVIGSHDPEVVMQKYNEIAQMSPRAATQPAVMRSTLRRHLQGDVQPFEHNELLNVEKGLRENDKQPDDTMKLKPTPKSILG